MKRATIVGAAGYVGGEMIRLLLNHPFVELVSAQSSSSADKPLYSVHQDLFGESDMLFCLEPDLDVDVIFLCSGHGKSKSFLDSHSLKESCVVIDLGNDFRLNKDKEVASRSFVYGLVDYFSQEIVSSNSIANPGCFATAIQLGLLPLAEAGELVDDVHITATTGSTGAGQSPSATTHFSWRANNLSTYKNFTHQHLGEISESVLALQSDYKGSLNFVPYRGDFPRGIIATIHTKSALTIEELTKLYNDKYSTSRFTFVSSAPINLKQVVNTNKSLVNVEKHGDYVLVTVVIDNLLRGAAGQAVENMNIILGLPIDSGLKLKPSAF